MTDTTADEPIDWNRFWSEADCADRASATPSTHHVRGLLADFFTAKGVPDSFADVGCGPGVVTFHVAECYPEVTAIGYDAAASVLVENRQQAARERSRTFASSQPSSRTSNPIGSSISSSVSARSPTSQHPSALSGISMMQSHPTVSSSWAISISAGRHITSVWLIPRAASESGVRT
ncbi:hypothetical protein ACFQL7_06210 [Halocatena marina]|uniref:Methyltransferase domain-containing protein n=1 Tax=Halocatena marina TaxID=2934937 RepID=A0ABD5YJB3_9EURY